MGLDGFQDMITVTPCHPTVYYNPPIYPLWHLPPLPGEQGGGEGQETVCLPVSGVSHGSLSQDTRYGGSEETSGNSHSPNYITTLIFKNISKLILEFYFKIENKYYVT